MRVRATPAKNENALSPLAETDEYKVVIKKIYLQCTSTQPRDITPNPQEQRSRRDAALYDVEHPETSTRTTGTGSKQVTTNDVFPTKLPKAAPITPQTSSDPPGNIKTNPPAFNRMQSPQLHVNNQAHPPPQLQSNSQTATPIEMIPTGISTATQATSAGLEMKPGDCPTNTTNSNTNHTTGAVPTPDKEHPKHPNPQKEAEVRPDLSSRTQPQLHPLPSSMQHTTNHIALITTDSSQPQNEYRENQ